MLFRSYTQLPLLSVSLYSKEGYTIYMTNSVIYSFSATGNSLSAARRIASRLDAKVIPITKETSLDCSADQIGFVFPDYFSGIPKTVSDFLEKINVTHSDPYIYAVITYGAGPGAALNLVQSILAKRKIHLSYGKLVKMVGTYIPKIGRASCRERV